VAKTRATSSGLAKLVEFTGDRAIDKAQRNQHATQTALNQNPLTPRFGTWVKNQTITTTNYVIVHGLGRAINGWAICRIKTGAAALIEVAADATTLTLKTTSGTTVVDLWIF